ITDARGNASALARCRSRSRSSMAAFIVFAPMNPRGTEQDAYHGRMPLEGGFAPYTRELRFLFARITAMHTALSVVCIRGGARAARTYLQCSCRNYVAPNRPHEKGHGRLRDRGLRCSDRARHSTR